MERVNARSSGAAQLCYVRFDCFRKNTYRGWFDVYSLVFSEGPGRVFAVSEIARWRVALVCSSSGGYPVNRGAASFVADNPQSVLVTRRRDGGLQASPVRVLVDSTGMIVACTRESTAKAKNLARDSRFALCVTSKDWVGPWVTLEGTAELIYLPEARQVLKEFYIQRDGSIVDDTEFFAKMKEQGRLLIRFHVDRTSDIAPS